MCNPLIKTSPLIISAKASGNEMLPFFTDFTSVPSRAIPHSTDSSMK